MCILKKSVEMNKILLKLRKQTGFTLIELLLVIAVLAVLVTFGMSTYRERALNAKAEKVAQQMQLIMQAASNYYTRNNCWPNNFPDSTTPAGHKCIGNVGEDFMAVSGGYFPSGTAMRHPTDAHNFRLYNPFSPTLAGNADNINYAYTYTRSGDSSNPEGRFRVRSGALPSADFARRVAAQLPNATSATTSPFQVTAEIYPPGTQYLPPYIVEVVGKGENDLAGNLVSVWPPVTNPAVNGISYTCPIHYKPVFTASIQDFKINDAGFVLKNIRSMSVQVERKSFPDGSKITKGKNCTITGDRKIGPTTIRCYPYVEIGGGTVIGPVENVQDQGAWFFYTGACCLDTNSNCKAYPEYLDQ
jgi:prepilin-type N-terminal cleavage/methylation domain-containing protein